MSDKVVKTEIVEGKWRCAHPNQFTDEPCNHENRGPSQMCEKCYHPRPIDVIFYFPDDARVVTEGKEIHQALSGPDWKCMSCGYDNKATDVHCHHCGQLRKEDEEEWLEMGGDLKTREYGPGGAPKSVPESIKADFHPSGHANPSFDRAGPSGGGYNLFSFVKIAGIVLAVVALVFAIWYFVFDTKPLDVKVSGFRWERSVEIEKERTVTEEDWSIPAGGREIRRTERQNGTKDVYDHSETVNEPVYGMVQDGEEEYDCGTVDMGNGYAQKKKCKRPKMVRKQTGTIPVEHKKYRKEPTYATWYTYQIDRWYHERTARATGNDQNPFWPEYNCGFRERVESKHESYTVVLVPVEPHDKLNDLSKDLGEASWKRLEKGELFVAEVNRLGGVMELREHR